MKLTSKAVTALINTAAREGAVVQAEASVLAELTAAGLIGPARGLTRSGWIRRARESEALLNASF